MKPWDPVTASLVVARALGWVGQGRYWLGSGAPYIEPSPFGNGGNPVPGCCDCSGFIAWACRYARGPWNTNAIVRDAEEGGRRDRFRLVKKEEKVRPGDVIVYPGPDKDHDGERDAPGHCGVIVEVLSGFARGQAEWWEDLRVAHCSPRKQNAAYAIKLTDATLWAGRGYLVRPLHVMTG